MTRTISATQAKTSFGALVESIANGEGDVIVENRGAAQVAIIAISEYEELARARDQQRRAEALMRLHALREEISARNADLTEEEGQAFIKELVDETMRSLLAKGIIRYKE